MTRDRLMAENPVNIMDYTDPRNVDESGTILLDYGRCGEGQSGM